MHTHVHAHIHIHKEKEAELQPNVVVHSCDPSTWVPKSGGLLQVQGQCRLHSEDPASQGYNKTLSQKAKVAGHGGVHLYS